MYLENQHLVEGMQEQGLLPPSLGDLPAFIATRGPGGSTGGGTGQPTPAEGYIPAGSEEGPSLATTRCACWGSQPSG